MDRLTKRAGDIVYMVKDGQPLAPMAMSGQDIRQALMKLAEYEDGQHGKWLNFLGDYSMAECSNCCEYYDVSQGEKPDKKWFDLFNQFYKYCPACGARMDGDK